MDTVDSPIEQEGPTGPGMEEVPPQEAAAATGPSEEEEMERQLRALKEAPYSKETLAKITAFYKKRVKNPTAYTYTPEGNLQIMEGAKTTKKGKTDAGGVLYLKRFVPLEPEERDLIEQDRLDQLSKLDEMYSNGLIKLREAWTDYRLYGSMRAVIGANQALAEIDAMRASARSAVRDVSVIENPLLRDIFFDKAALTGKLLAGGVASRGKDPFGMSVYKMNYYDLSLQNELGKYVPGEEGEPEVAEAPEEEGPPIAPEEAAYRKRLADGRVARIFYDQGQDVIGFLSPFVTSKRFTMEGTEYASVFQAYQAERAKELNKMELRASILKTISDRTIRVMIARSTMKENPQNPQDLLFRIYSALYQQYPELNELLLATGRDTLVFADPDAGPLGVGFKGDDDRVLDSSKWRGENLVGRVQEELRTRLRGEGIGEGGGRDDDVAERAITEEEQQKAKVGAIIAAARRR